MSLHSLEDFLKQHYPFNKLNHEELTLCLKNIDISYYAKDEIIISPNNISNTFFIIIKGEVNQYLNEELRAIYHANDSFDSNSLIYNKTNFTFKVHIDLICYELNKKTFLKLLELNKKFKEYYLQDLSAKLQRQKKDEYANKMSGFMVARVSELFLHKICIVESNTSLGDAINKSIEYNTSTIVVQKDNKYGVITDSILKKDVLLKNKDLNIKVDEIAVFPFICIKHDEFLFQALLLLIEYTIKRIGVLKDGQIIGVINQVDILSYFANHSYIIATKIQNASTLDELKKASMDINKTVKSLFVKSVKSTYIAKMVSQLNLKIYNKLFDLIIPLNLRNKCAFLVMGSEGRDEQILKTDQDNALIINDDTNTNLYIQYAKQINQSLLDFGFPKCEGNIMLTNPFWRKSNTQFKEQIDIWFNNNNMESYMNLAIFFDAKTAAGDNNLLKSVKTYLFSKIKNQDVFMAYFAKASLNFETPIGIFSNILSSHGEVDIKKGAIFAIVHGIRALALEYKLNELSTISRIKKLNSMNIISKQMASELIEAFGLLLMLRLEVQIKSMQESKTPNNLININNLGKLQRDMLKDSFQIVNTFKKFIISHFRLNSVS